MTGGYRGIKTGLILLQKSLVYFLFLQLRDTPQILLLKIAKTKYISVFEKPFQHFHFELVVVIASMLP